MFACVSLLGISQNDILEQVNWSQTLDGQVDPNTFRRNKLLEINV